jgi:hypothetical protein
MFDGETTQSYVPRRLWWGLDKIVVLVYRRVSFDEGRIALSMGMVIFSIFVKMPGKLWNYSYCLIDLTIKPWANEETLLRKHCFLPMFRHVSQSGQTLGNSEKRRETSNVSEFARKHFCFSGSKFCFRTTMFPRVDKQGNIWGNIENHKCFHNNVS